MRIYHNIPALTAYNSLNSTNNALQKSIETLSTGLRINSAADDAAGFAISEKMRAQISGLEQAARNAQDANSMLQVAEGALEATNSMLQRMRELSVQASNDTLTAQDRSYIQLEVDQLSDQINRIANTTQFNKKRLLDGSSAGIVSSSNLEVKAYVNGSLREIDQFGQKKSFEGNYKIRITVDPSQTGQGQVQKTSIMTIKHPNVITNTEINSTDGVTKVTVDGLPAANYQVTAATSPADAGATITGVYGFMKTAAGESVYAEDDEDETTPIALNAEQVGELFEADAGNAQNNASVLFEITSVSDNSVTLKAQSTVLSADGTVNSFVKKNITISRNEGESTPVDLSELIGETVADDDEAHFSLGLGDISEDYLLGDVFEVGSKIVYNITGSGVPENEDTGAEAIDADIAVTVAGDLDVDWPYSWHESAETNDEYTDTNGNNKPLVSQPVSYNLNSEACQNKELHFRNYFINSQNGTVYEGDVILTTNKDFNTDNISDGDTLTSFTAAYIGKTATGDTKLRDLNTFWNTSGVFMLDSPQTITITQGNGDSVDVTLYATDTLKEVEAKFNDAIANGLGQAAFVNGTKTNKFCTFVEKQQGVDMPTQGLETVPGTFIFRSLLAGDAGGLTFSGDEDLINTLAMNVVREGSAAAFQASIYDAHNGTPIATNVKVSDNHLIGVLHDNVDIEFNAMAGIEATWSDSEDNFILTPKTEAYEAVIHIVDSSTVFQIGANEGEDIAIDIGNMSANSLGVGKVNVSTRAAASKALGQIDAAINKVSTQRAKIGAYQNSLEYTIDNLTTTSANLTAAESRIRDADMAQTMMEFVKLQILNQSGTSMLAQANQLPQSVLSLLQ